MIRLAFSNLLLAGSLVSALLVPCVADDAAKQEPPAKEETPKTTGPVKDPNARPALEAFVKDLDEWKRIIKELRAQRMQYENAESEDAAMGFQKKFESLLVEGRSMIPKLRKSGMTAYRLEPNRSASLIKFLYQMAEDDLKHDKYEEAAQLAQLMIDNNCGLNNFYLVGGIAAYATSDFERAQEYLRIAQKEDVVQAIGTQHPVRIIEAYLNACATNADRWKEEAAIRAQQADDDLPQVKLSTTKGDIVLELFEKEAPGTVANFIDLVEKEFYDGKPFEHVIPGRLAQAGKDTSGEPGYKIYCECNDKGFRKHFRGSVSMVKDMKPNTAEPILDTAYSEFFISLMPNARLDGHYTVFGRVVKGMPVLAELQRTVTEDEEEVQPDLIRKAVVLRKDEGKKYLPRKVKD